MPDENQQLFDENRWFMSEQKKTRPEVPEGKARYVVTRQMKANEKGFVGYETVWEPFQKEAEYETPKRPWADSVAPTRKAERVTKRNEKTGEDSNPRQFF